ncbi:sodium:proton exchanger [Candidatus Uhrbacteria bacterium CG10_big_fil_rev_8_21_14_0_10_50_16]|uniref:Sodium:proton exchanger n=1 Tax=Candidatus Uhrbacteria bacterium CG10_big_fil_rev_8_21_14_0_10_50_16 TaxID=1975039 RepID=A0A2H0RNT1_9BACT|nr:MAG: sodium:proton exchanger [Candidatus Uhrbacteria bacterium CG10_big_fil_rev_8_21_14_0_10_50_16]
MQTVKRHAIFFLALFGGLLAQVAFASGSESEAGHATFAVTILWIAVLLMLARISGLVEKIGQPSVLGELVLGVVLGNLALLGFDWFEPMKHDIIIEFLAELGVVILLFQIGLESNITQMKKVGLQAILVAVVGVVVPFVLGTYVVGPWLLPGLDSNAYLFLGAALTATSVGITARVFQELGKLHIKEAQIVLGAAVFDDVLGLIILAIVSAIATVGAVSFGVISLIAGKAIIFLVGAIVIGQFAAKWLGKFFSKIHTGIGMKFTMAISFGLFFAFLASEIGLAPIIGAFAAGLVLDPVHFRYFKDPHIVKDVKKIMDAKVDAATRTSVLEAMDKHADRHIEEIVEPLGLFLVPIFFVVTGMTVDLTTLSDVRVVLVSLAITLVAIGGKYVAGFAAGKGVNRSLVGFGMVPRGEVGLIFASIGIGLGVISNEVFSVIVIMVILTTLVSPPILSFMLKRAEK